MASIEENHIYELYKFDKDRLKEEINNVSIAQGNVINLEVSIAKESGKILNKITPKIADFFGYELLEFDNISNINLILPDNIKKIHPQLIMNIVESNKSVLLKKSKTVFCQNK